MAKSPFPGMDPFLEQDWPDVHSRLVTYICDQLQEQLPQDLCARMESRVLVEGKPHGEPRERYPDVHVSEARGGSAGAAVLDLPMAAVEPDLFLVEARGEQAIQRFIEIVDPHTRSRVVTTIELVSPSNKVPGPGQKLYLAKRDECLDADVNVVEIDLTRGGNRLSIMPGLGYVQPPPTYVGCVRRATQPDSVAVYLMPLDRPLRSMRIPLRATDEDVVLHLQPLVEQAYVRGRYGNLDYTQPLYPPLAKEDAAFVEQMLKQAADHFPGSSG
jgi:hypothetical protein